MLHAVTLEAALYFHSGVGRLLIMCMLITGGFVLRNLS